MFLYLKKYILVVMQIKIANQGPKNLEDLLNDYKVFFEVVDFLKEYEAIVKKIEKDGFALAILNMSKEAYGFTGEILTRHLIRKQELATQIEIYKNDLQVLIKILFEKKIINELAFSRNHDLLIKKIRSFHPYFPPI